MDLVLRGYSGTAVDKGSRVYPEGRGGPRRWTVEVLEEGQSSGTGVSHLAGQCLLSVECQGPEGVVWDRRRTSGAVEVG